MFKKLAIYAILANLSVSQAIELSTLEQQHVYDFDQAQLDEEIADELIQVKGMSRQEAHSEIGATYTCTSGIERFEKGPSNTWTTF